MVLKSLDTDLNKFSYSDPDPHIGPLDPDLHYRNIAHLVFSLVHKIYLYISNDPNPYLDPDPQSLFAHPRIQISIFSNAV